MDKPSVAKVKPDLESNPTGFGKLSSLKGFSIVSLFILLLSLSSCRPSLNHSDLQARREAVNDLYTQLEAVKQITDQAALAKIAVEDDRLEVCEAAVSRLTDQTRLAEIALEHKYPYIRIMAIRKLTDQTILSSIVSDTTHFDRRIRNTAIDRLTDQTLLTQIATTHDNVFVRLAAAKKLRSQTLLAKIALENQNATARRAAVYSLTNQGMLASIAAEDDNSTVREAAVSRLADQKMLAKFALEDQNAAVRRAAVRKLTDQRVLTTIRVNDEDTDVTKAAAERLIDIGALARAQLPPFTESLFGYLEVRIQNPNSFEVKAGVRKGAKGMNWTIRAHSVASAYVPNGRYDIYFIYSDRPESLFQGDSFTIKGKGVEIQLVSIVNGNYSIRQVK